MLVVAGGHVKESCRVVANLFPKFAQRNEVATARRHGNFLAITEQRYKLYEWCFEVLRRIPHRAEPAANPGNVTMMIRAKNVDEQIETALTYDFSDDLERGMAMANTAINRPLGNGVVMSGKITDAGLDRIKATEIGIYMGLHTVGELQLKVSGLEP